MVPLPATITDPELIAYIDRWAELLEREDYDAAFAMTEHEPGMDWTPARIREIVTSYDEATPGQKVTLHSGPAGMIQRKEVNRWTDPGNGSVGEIWYDLNIDGLASDLTATFYLVRTDAGIVVSLNDIHVM